MKKKRPNPYVKWFSRGVTRGGYAIRKTDIN